MKFLFEFGTLVWLLVYFNFGLVCFADGWILRFWFLCGCSFIWGLSGRLLLLFAGLLGALVWFVLLFWVRSLTGCCFCVWCFIWFAWIDGCLDWCLHFDWLCSILNCVWILALFGISVVLVDYLFWCLLGFAWFCYGWVWVDLFCWLYVCDLFVVRINWDYSCILWFVVTLLDSWWLMIWFACAFDWFVLVAVCFLLVVLWFIWFDLILRLKLLSGCLVGVMTGFVCLCVLVVWFWSGLVALFWFSLLVFKILVWCFGFLLMSCCFYWLHVFHVWVVALPWCMMVGCWFECG